MQTSQRHTRLLVSELMLLSCKSGIAESTGEPPTSLRLHRRQAVSRDALVVGRKKTMGLETEIEFAGAGRMETATN